MIFYDFASYAVFAALSFLVVIGEHYLSKCY